jgi:hypothetical protein
VSDQTAASSEYLDVVWGADAIAAAINRTPRATYHMMENNALPGAKKVAGRWCFSPSAFRSLLVNTPVRVAA